MNVVPPHPPKGLFERCLATIPSTAHSAPKPRLFPSGGSGLRFRYLAATAAVVLGTTAIIVPLKQRNTLRERVGETESVLAPVLSLTAENDIRVLTRERVDGKIYTYLDIYDRNRGICHLNDDTRSFLGRPPQILFPNETQYVLMNGTLGRQSSTVSQDEKRRRWKSTFAVNLSLLQNRADRAALKPRPFEVSVRSGLWRGGNVSIIEYVDHLPVGAMERVRFRFRWFVSHATGRVLAHQQVREDTGEIIREQRFFFDSLPQEERYFKPSFLGIGYRTVRELARNAFGS